jgi:hypothetical protein
MRVNQASSFRRMACGLCLMVAPALLLVAEIVDPSSGDSSDRKHLQSLVDNVHRVELSVALSMVGFALLAIGLVGLVHVIRGRGVTLANIGGALSIIGVIFFVALVSFSLADLNSAVHLGTGPADKLNDTLDDYWPSYVLLVPAIAGTSVGFLLLGAAVIRSRVAHIAAGILVIVGTLLVFGSGGNSDVVGAIGDAALLGGFGMAGLRILGMTDDQWDGRAPLTAGPPPAA